MSGDSIREIVAKNIKYYRKIKGLSQDKLSQKCGLSVRFISRAENSPQNLTIETLESIAHALDTTVSDLTGATDHKNFPKIPARTSKAIDQVVKFLQACQTVSGHPSTKKENQT